MRLLLSALTLACATASAVLLVAAPAPPATPKPIVRVAVERRTITKVLPRRTRIRRVVVAVPAAPAVPASAPAPAAPPVVPAPRPAVVVAAPAPAPRAAVPVRHAPAPSHDDGEHTSESSHHGGNEHDD